MEDDKVLIFLPDSTSTIRFVGDGYRWRMEDDGEFVAEFIADGAAHAMLVAQHILKSYDEWYGSGAGLELEGTL